MNGSAPSARIATAWLSPLTAWLLRTFLAFSLSVYTNRRVIWRLAIYDLRSRYAGTLIGSLWAIISPAIMILVFWFVAAYGLRISSDTGPPYFFVLFCGFLPWIAFNEALTSGAASVLNHAYLVKKIAFPLEILPIVNVVSSLIVHLCLTLLLVIILLAAGMSPTLHFFQVIYFMIAMASLAIGLAWTFASLNVFHRDMGQVLGVITTIWFWSTPILWPVQNLSAAALRIAKLNPFFYVAEGYRNALLYGRPLWALWPLDAYFWTVTAILFLLGAIVFRRLQPHFADVL